MTDAEDFVEEIAEETRKTYSLTDRLKNRPMRTATKTIYTDEPLADELGGAEPQVHPDDPTITRGTRRWGILGEIDLIKPIVDNARAVIEKGEESEANTQVAKDALEEYEPKLEALQAKAKPLYEELEKTAITFNLRAVPEIIAKDCRRKAKDHLEIKGKNIPEKLEDRYRDVYAAYILAASTESFRDHASDDVVTDMTFADAEAVLDFAPRSEWDKLDRAMGELSFKNSIASNIADTVDF